MPNLSTCKSPQQMMGAIIKTFYAEREKLDPTKIVSVSIMPCTAKKFECERPEMGRDYVPDVDYVLTTRELAELFRMSGVDLDGGRARGGRHAVRRAVERGQAVRRDGRRDGGGGPLGPLPADRPGAGRAEDRGPARAEGLKEVHAKIGDLEVGAAVVSRPAATPASCSTRSSAGRKDLHFIEVMTCPGGCINGGGQPIGADLEAVKARMKALYQIDRDAALRVSHKNKWVQRLYEEFLGKPLGEKSHKLLHTQYAEARRDGLRRGAMDMSDARRYWSSTTTSTCSNRSRSMLQSDGYEVHQAPGPGGGRGALVLGFIPDLAVLDLMMENDGLGLRPLPRHQEALPRDAGDHPDRGPGGHRPRLQGPVRRKPRSWVKADSLLDKPVRPEQLKAEVKRLLAG